jgi:hypothetical protein
MLELIRVASGLDSPRANILDVVGLFLQPAGQSSGLSTCVSPLPNILQRPNQKWCERVLEESLFHWLAISNMGVHCK